jgi:hypothetical protein
MNKTTIDFNQLSNSADDLFDCIIAAKQPLLIKKLLTDNTLDTTLLAHKDNITPLYSRGAVPFLYTYFDSPELRSRIFSLPIISQFVGNKKLKFRKEMRLWQHQQGNISHLHYDQRSTDLLNLCLHGEKKWLFASPESAIYCWPFFNIALPFQLKKKSVRWLELTMSAGDLLYIPRNWYHQVTTTKDDTRNINIIMNDLTDPTMQTREQELAAFRSLIIPNYIYGDDIEVLNNSIKQVPKTRIFARLLKELSPVIIILSLLYLTVAVL